MNLLYLDLMEDSTETTQLVRSASDTNERC